MPVSVHRHQDGAVTESLLYFFRLQSLSAAIRCVDAP